MVVLEGGGMLSTSGNQYLQPDYLSPLPTTLDAKKSPLALLAQTCSQIGADSPTTKPLISSLDKPKKENNNRSPPVKPEKTPPRTTPTTESKFGVFKPYENTVVTKKQSEDVSNSRPPSSKQSPDGALEKKELSPDRKSVSPPTRHSAPPSETGKASPANSEHKSSTPTARGASPIIRSGLEILHGHSKDLQAYKHGLAGLGSPFCCPPGLEQHANPAFRPPFPGAPFSPHHAALLAAGYPGAAPGPYLSYARVKTPSGGEALVPVCKDPYCSSCQFGAHSQLMMGGGGAPCPSGCTQCDHQKYGLMAMHTLAPPASALAYAQLGRPYVCNWIAGEAYCGKRFGTSEELLQHLRTHTSGAEAASQLLGPQALFPRPGGYASAPLSPLSARYHPYGKPGMPSPYSAFNPTALGAYYSPYSIYGQRIGAAVHQ